MSIDLKELGIVGIIIGVASAAYSFYQSRKTKKEMEELASKIGVTLDDISKNTKVEVAQTVVDAAVENAVERETHRAAVEAVAIVKADMHDTITRKVKKEVDSQYAHLSDEVSEKISEQVEGISESALADKVIPRVEAKLTKRGEEKIDQAVNEARRKADSALSAVLGTYNNISNVAGTFIRNISGGDGRTVSFKI